MRYYADGTMNKLPKPLLISQNIETNILPPSSYRYRGFTYGRFQPFDLVNDSDMWGNNQLNWISLYLLNKLGNPNLIIDDIESINEILEIKSFDAENIRRVKMIGERMSEEFDYVKLLIKDFKIEDQDRLKQEIFNIMNKSPIENKLNKIEIQLQKIEKIVEQLGNKFAISINGKLQKD